MHNKCNALASSPNHLPTPSVKKLSSMKLVPDAKKLGDQFLLFFSHSFMSDSLQPHGLQHVRPPCPSLSPRVYSNSCPLSWWCHSTISSFVTHFSCRQSFPAPGSFPVSQLLHQVAKVLELQLQHQSFQWILRMISFRIGWFDLLAVHRTLKSLLQQHKSKAWILWHSAFFMVHLSHPCMTTGKTIALTRWTFVGKVMSL